MEEDDAMGFGDVATRTAALTKRGRPRPIKSKVAGLFDFRSNRYPSRKEYIKAVIQKAGAVAWWAVESACDSTAVKEESTTDINKVPTALDTEHPLDVGLLFIWLPVRRITGLSFRSCKSSCDLPKIA